jgi:LAO/AO transport system kinase
MPADREPDSLRPESLSGDAADEADTALGSAILRGNRRALAKGITLIESTRPEHQMRAQRLLRILLPHSGNAVRIGVSGVPGVGKSTFIEAFGSYITAVGKRVAVLAVDPSSTRTGGSILGDKTRMVHLAANPNAFIRPSPSAGSLGGVARRTREVSIACEAAGYDVVVIETVGVGQSEVAVAAMVDFFLVLMLAGAGDELQGIKKGIIEIADALAINKTDGDNAAAANRAAAEYAGALRLLHPVSATWRARVVTISSIEGRGMDAVWQMILEHHHALSQSGELERKREHQRLAWFRSLLEDGLKRHFLERLSVKTVVDSLETQVRDGQLSATDAARRALAAILPAEDSNGDRRSPQSSAAR